ncbi:MAG TPA: helix-turn-helix domain-containing protein [Gemmataceae bacterium]|nr:helix-turn-helix domain-containing protein [Gemmataceae bacterium]
MPCPPTASADDVIAMARRLPPAEQARLALEVLGLPAAPEWMTYAEAALALRRSRATVCRLVKAGRLAHNARRGHGRRVARESVLALSGEAARRAAATVARVLARAGCTPVSSRAPPRPAKPAGG